MAGEFGGSGGEGSVTVGIIREGNFELIYSNSIDMPEKFYVVQNGVLKNEKYIKADTRQSVSQAEGYVLWDALACGPESYGLAWLVGDGSNYTKAIVRLSSPVRKDSSPGGLSMRCGTTPAKSSQSESTAYGDASYGNVGILSNDEGTFNDVRTWSFNLIGNRKGMYFVLQAYYRGNLWPKGRQYHIYDLYLE